MHKFSETIFDNMLREINFEVVEGESIRMTGFVTPRDENFNYLQSIPFDMVFVIGDIIQVRSSAFSTDVVETMITDIRIPRKNPCVYSTAINSKKKYRQPMSNFFYDVALYAVQKLTK